MVVITGSGVGFWPAALSLMLFCAVLFVAHRPRVARIVGGLIGSGVLALTFIRAAAVPLDCEPTWYCVYLWLCCLERLI